MTLLIEQSGDPTGNIESYDTERWADFTPGEVYR